MALIPEERRPEFLGLLGRARVGEALSRADQHTLLYLPWVSFKEVYGVRLISFCYARPVTQEFIDAIRKDLGLGGPVMDVGGDIWL